MAGLGSLIIISQGFKMKKIGKKIYGTESVVTSWEHGGVEVREEILQRYMFEFLYLAKKKKKKQ